MSRWMKMSLSPGVAWALLCCTTIKADPPETATAATTAPPSPQATSFQFQDASVPQVQIDAVIYSFETAKLAENTKTPVAELLKRNGFKFLDASEQPQRVGAVRIEPLALELLQTKFGSACTVLSRPVVRTQVGSETTVTVGEAHVAGTLGWSGTRLTILPLLDSDGLIVMTVRLENATHDDATDAEGTGTDATSITTQVVSLIAKLQAGQQLLVANGTSESDLTRFVQLTPRIVTEDAVVNEVHDVRNQVRVSEIDR